jgi:hypothetical protein
MIDKPEPRRFPPPWTVEETDACFIVKDRGGMSLAYVYFEHEPGRCAAAKLLTRDEARRIVANIAKLPDLLRSEVGHHHSPGRRAAWSDASVAASLKDRASGNYRSHLGFALSIARLVFTYPRCA